MGAPGDAAAAAAADRAPLGPAPDLAELVRFATLAPSGHNTQPWRFAAAHDAIEIRPDFTRRTPVVDPEDHHLFVSLGAAAETLALAAGARGRPAEIRFDREGDGRLVVALGSGPAAASALFEAIPVRQSTRADYDGRPLAVGELDLLERAARAPGVGLALVTDPAARDRLAALIVEANGRQIEDPAFVAELTDWLRFNPAQALATRDGLYAVASGNPSLPGWLARPVFRLVFRPGSENAKIARQLASSAGVAVFFAERDDAEHWTRVGRAFQRFALQATALGIRTAHLNQPVEVRALRGALAAEAGAPGGHPCLVIRFGRGPLLPYALRRPAASVLA
jgi:nitroreductase